MRWRGLVAVLALVPAVAIALVDVDIAAYRGAASGQLGAVTGRAYEPGARSAAADRPLVGTAVTLLPRSETLLGTLHDIKRGARDSITAYRAAAAAVRRAREAYERALWAEGALDLVRSTEVATDGTFTVGELPPGRWVLIAVRSVFVERSSRRAPKRDAEVFVMPPKIVGYATVHVWVMELRVTGGRAEAVELTDRNAWLTGITEERAPDATR